VPARCRYCYAESGPDGQRGSLTETDWRSVVDQAERLGARMVQFIGGEPTLHPSLPALIDWARSHDVEVEVFFTLVHIKPALWEVLSRPRGAAATSYYSDGPDERVDAGPCGP
jgi:MoaA/NifB/PqqE/SkfB family radical SAM enzyme